MILAAAILAQAACAPRDKAIETLADDFGEVRQSIGLSGNNTIVEVYANLETGSWTILSTNASGLACMVASGAYFSILHEELQGEAL